MKVILASKSPRRKELLSLITENFVIKTANVDEALPEGITPDKAVEYLSKIKEYLQKNHGGVYAKFLRRQTPLPSGKREKSPCSTTNFLYTRKMSSEAPQFKISGV